MKRYIKYRITTLEPLKLAGEGSQQGTVVTRNFIQGAAIRGVLIGRYLREHPDEEIDASAHQREKFLTKTKFYSAYIAADKQATIPVPYVFQADKQVMREQEERGEDIDIQNRFHKEQEKKGTQPVKRNAFCVMNDECMYTLDVNKVEHLHIQKSEEKNKEAIMFRYEAIAPGQTFIGFIQCEEEWVADFVKLLEDDICYIGGSKGSGYGKCKLQLDQTMDYATYRNEFPVELENSHKNQFILYALSDLVLFDQNGMVANAIDEEFLKETLELEKVEKRTMVCDTSITSGYNSKHRAHSVQQTAVRAGSVFQYEYIGTLQMERIQELEEQGVGIRREEGYGRILVNPDFSQNKTKAYVHEQMANPSSNTLDQILDKEENAMVEKWTKKIALQKNSDYIMYQLAQKDFMEKRVDWKLNKTKSNALKDVLDKMYATRGYDAYQNNVKKLSNYVKKIQNTSAFDATMLYVPEGGVGGYSSYDTSKRPPVSLYQFLQKMEEGTASLDLIHYEWKKAKIDSFSQSQNRIAEDNFYECCLYLKELVRYNTREEA